jgi:hypothetical protein
MNGDAVARVNLRRSPEIIFRLNSNGYAREKLRAQPASDAQKFKTLHFFRETLDG